VPKKLSSSRLWDATVLDTFAWGHKPIARQAGFPATKAEDAKCQKYHDLESNYHFQSVAIEITDMYSKFTVPCRKRSSINKVAELGCGGLMT